MITNPEIVTPTCQTFNGRKYYLCKQKNGRGYFLRQEFRHRGKMLALHIQVWSHHNGTIPPKMDIHHIDGDTANNRLDNLEMLTRSAHKMKHRQQWTPEQYEASKRNVLEHAMPKAKAWHASPEGRAWHSEHAIRHRIGFSNKGRKCPDEAKAILRAKRLAYFQTDAGKELLRKMGDASRRNQQILREKRQALAVSVAQIPNG